MSKDKTPTVAPRVGYKYKTRSGMYAYVAYKHGSGTFPFVGIVYCPEECETSYESWQKNGYTDQIIGFDEDLIEELGPLATPEVEWTTEPTPGFWWWWKPDGPLGVRPAKVITETEVHVLTTTFQDSIITTTSGYHFTPYTPERPQPPKVDEVEPKQTAGEILENLLNRAKDDYMIHRDECDRFVEELRGAK